jgi:O-antigen/teichoic acid export membrane protein
MRTGASTRLPAVPEEERADHTSTLARHTLAYGLSGLVIPLVGVVTVPIYARILSPAEFGLLELGMALLSITLVVADGGLSQAAQRHFYEFTAEEADKRRDVLFTALVGTLAGGLLVAAALVLLRNALVADWALDAPGEEDVVVIVALITPAMALALYLREVMRLRFRTAHYLTASTLTATLTGGLGVAVVVILDLDVEGIFLAMLAASVAGAAYGAVAIHREVAGHFSARELRALLVFGLPLVPAAVSHWVLLLADRIILRRLEDLDAVGQYGIAGRISGVLVIGMTGFVLALGPYLLSVFADRPDQERFVRGRTLTYLTFVLCLGAVLLTLFAEEIVAVVAPGYDEAPEAVGPLAFGAIGYGAAAVLITGIALARRTLYVALLATIAGAANIALNFTLIPPFGIFGAGLASAGGYAVLAVLYYWAAQRVYPTPFEPGKVLTIVGLALAASLAAALPVDGIADLAVKLAAFAAFVAAVVATRVIGPAELRELGRFGRVMVSRRAVRTG